jgi:hypothetical protein
MIGFGICVGSSPRFERYAAPGLALTAEPNSAIETVSGYDSIFSAYNDLLDRCRFREDLEALVLLHEDVEIVDPLFCGKAREALSDPEVAIAGVIGARGVTRLGGGTPRKERRGRVAETARILDYGFASVDVDAVDGLMLILAPWAVTNLRFDEERFSGFHGYDLDICFQARAAGRRVIVHDISVVHHVLTADTTTPHFRSADEAWRRKWMVPHITGLDTSIQASTRLDAKSEEIPALGTQRASSATPLEGQPPPAVEEGSAAATYDAPANQSARNRLESEVEILERRLRTSERYREKADANWEEAERLRRKGAHDHARVEERLEEAERRNKKAERQNKKAKRRNHNAKRRNQKLSARLAAIEESRWWRLRRRLLR